MGDLRLIVGPTNVLTSFALTGGADKASAAFDSDQVSAGILQLSVVGGGSASADGTLKLQASIDGSNGWCDISTNFAPTATVGSNAFNNGTNATAYFALAFHSVRAPYIRGYLDSGAGMAGTITMQIWASES